MKTISWQVSIISRIGHASVANMDVHIVRTQYQRTTKQPGGHSKDFQGMTV